MRGTNKAKESEAANQPAQSDPQGTPVCARTKSCNADGSDRSRKGQDEGPLQTPRQIEQTREEIT